MDTSQLQETLSKIHQELANADVVDDKSRELLEQVLHDIERLLAGGKDTAAPVGELGVVRAVRNAVEHFEDSHPFLASLLGRIADGLSSMGI